MKLNENIINHHGKYYVGTVSDYIVLCTRDNGTPDNPRNVGLREATINDLEEYKERKKKKVFTSKWFEMPQAKKAIVRKINFHKEEK